MNTQVRLPVTHVPVTDGSLPFMVPMVLICFGIIFWPDAILYLPEKLGL